MSVIVVVGSSFFHSLSFRDFLLCYAFPLCYDDKYCECDAMAAAAAAVRAVAPIGIVDVFFGLPVMLPLH